MQVASFFALDPYGTPAPVGPRHKVQESRTIRSLLLCTAERSPALWENRYNLRRYTLSKSLKGVYCKRKEFAPMGANSFLLEYTSFKKGLVVQDSKKEVTKDVFPFRVDPFSKGDCCAGLQKGSHKSCLPCKKGRKIYHVYLDTLNYCDGAPVCAVKLKTLHSTNPLRQGTNKRS